MLHQYAALEAIISKINMKSSGKSFKTQRNGATEKPVGFFLKILLLTHTNPLYLPVFNIIEERKKWRFKLTFKKFHWDNASHREESFVLNKIAEEPVASASVTCLLNTWLLIQTAHRRCSTCQLALPPYGTYQNNSRPLRIIHVMKLFLKSDFRFLDHVRSTSATKIQRILVLDMRMVVRLPVVSSSKFAAFLMGVDWLSWLCTLNQC